MLPHCFFTKCVRSTWSKSNKLSKQKNVSFKPNFTFKFKFICAKYLRFEPRIALCIRIKCMKCFPCYVHYDQVIQCGSYQILNESSCTKFIKAKMENFLIKCGLEHAVCKWVSAIIKIVFILVICLWFIVITYIRILLNVNIDSYSENVFGQLFYLQSTVWSWVWLLSWTKMK